MSLHRRNPRRDAIETDCIDLLEAAGWSCLQISVKDGPDLIASKRGSGNWLIEVKSGKKKLRPGQQAWHSRWPENLAVVRSLEELQAWLRDQAKIP